MRLSNEVVLPAPPDRVFELINDVRRVAPCLPGATLDEQTDSETYRGTVKVKVGPISATYQGTVRFMETDQDQRRVVLDAKGADQHGSGNAEAKVRVQVDPHDDGSLLTLETDLVIRGKIAQFGGGALNSVSQKLMERFAGNLSDLLAEPDSATAEPEGSEEPATSRPTATPEDVPSDTPDRAEAAAELDGLSMVAVPLLKRAAPVVAALATGAVLGRFLSRHRSKERTVLADEVITATVHIGQQRLTVPARQVTSVLRSP